MSGFNFHAPRVRDAAQGEDTPPEDVTPVRGAARETPGNLVTLKPAPPASLPKSSPARLRSRAVRVSDKGARGVRQKQEAHVSQTKTQQPARGATAPASGHQGPSASVHSNTGGIHSNAGGIHSNAARGCSPAGSDDEFLPCLAPLCVTTMEPSPPPQPANSAAASQADAMTHPLGHHQGQVQGHFPGYEGQCEGHDGEYVDDFEDASDDDFPDSCDDLDFDDDLYDQLAFGVDIDPGDLEDGGQEGIDFTLTGRGGFELAIVGQQVSAPEAWGDERPLVLDPSTTLDKNCNRKETAGVSDVTSDKTFIVNKTHQFLLERKLGCSTFMIKDLSAERKNQFKICRKVTLPEVETSARMSVISETRQKIEHEHVIKVEDVFMEESSLNIIQEYCEGGNLHGLLMRARSFGETLNEIEVLDWFVQSLLALRHLHEKAIVHQDITTSNIYLKSNCVRLGAPLCFKRLYRKYPDKVPVKKVHYMAPEIHADDTITPAADIWSLGCVLYELCALKKLFRGKRRDDIISNISDISAPLPHFPINFNPSLANVWERVMQHDAKLRPTADEILQIPYVAEHLEDMKKSLEELENREDDSFGENIQHTPPGGWSDLDVDEDLLLTEEDARELLGF